jgi:hypothetical protein
MLSVDFIVFSHCFLETGGTTRAIPPRGSNHRKDRPCYDAGHTNRPAPILMPADPSLDIEWSPPLSLMTIVRDWSFVSKIAAFL